MDRAQPAQGLETGFCNALRQWRAFAEPDKAGHFIASADTVSGIMLREQYGGAIVPLFFHPALKR